MKEPRYDRLIEFDNTFGMVNWEKVVQEMDSAIGGFCHDEVDEYYDWEDKTYDVTMMFNSRKGVVEQKIIDYLNGHGYAGKYLIYKRLSN